MSVFLCQNFTFFQITFTAIFPTIISVRLNFMLLESWHGWIIFSEQSSYLLPNFCCEMYKAIWFALERVCVYLYIHTDIFHINFYLFMYFISMITFSEDWNLVVPIENQWRTSTASVKKQSVLMQLAKKKTRFYGCICICLLIVFA